MRVLVLLVLALTGCGELPVLESTIDSPDGITIRAVPGSVVAGSTTGTGHFFVLASDRNVDNPVTPARQRVTVTLPTEGGSFGDGQTVLLYRNLDALNGPVDCKQFTGRAEWGADDVITFDGICNTDTSVRVKGSMWGTLIAQERNTH